MDYKKMNNNYIVRIDKGEEIVGTIKQFCTEQSIKLGLVSGLGAVNEATIGLFETATKKYHSTVLSGDFEIASLTGNITTMNGEVYLHFHACISDDKYMTYGGHLNSAVVSATAEIIIIDFNGEVDREFNDEIGLNLLKL